MVNYVEASYNVGDVLGEGIFGSVCEATRISDGQKVAIKFIHKRGEYRTLAIPGYSEPLIKEVALMVKMSEPPLSPNVIQMIESFEDDEKIAIVMEYPQPCKTLEHYITENEMLCEEMVRILMRQAVQAVIDCIDHGVVHTDIHPGNILINTSTLDLKLIDFGCGLLFTSDAYDGSQYEGNIEYCPPEVTEMNRFHAISANVWSLGLLLLEMVNECLPYPESEEVLFVNPDLSGGLDLKVPDTTQD
ncbi:serine/threonine-protein kinase pim-2-like [Paramisgurnus dabryanus]|uniref:serine/threonine-protein kinase pim-2-like n=1 Tax=Paramisgurnus dabryanus TaxID=90735 RepID=UPI0031F3537A